MRPITFLVPSALDLAEDVVLDLYGAVLERCNVPLAPVRLASAALVPEILERVPGGLAWVPSSIAFVLKRLRLATPIVAVSPIGGEPRSSVLVVQPNVEGLVDFAGRRVGWVSRLSVTGHSLPRLYLESFGIDVDMLFRTQQFCGSHEAAIDALALGQVDVIATDTHRLPNVLARTPARVVASVGPVPSDLIVAGSALPIGVCEQLARGLESLHVDRFAFEPVREGHLSLFEMLRRHASELHRATVTTPPPSTVTLH